MGSAFLGSVQGVIRKSAVFAGTLGLAALVVTPSARAFPYCSGARAIIRPGPVEPGVSAVRFFPQLGGASATLRLFDADDQPVDIEMGRLGPDGKEAIFLRSARRLDPGEYRLEYTDDCTSAPRSISLNMAVADPLPSTLGELQAEYQAYCYGETVDTPYGRLPREHPPKVWVTLALDPAFAMYQPFTHLVIRDDLGIIRYSEFLESGLTAQALVHPACEDASAAPLALPLGRRAFTATATILDTSTAFEAAAPAIDVFCAEGCPEDGMTTARPNPPAPAAPPVQPAAASGGAPAMSSSSSNSDYQWGCSIGQRPLRASFPWLTLLVSSALYAGARRLRSNSH